MTVTSISASRASSDGTNIPLWGVTQRKELLNRKNLTTKEIINQLELSLGQPEEFESGVIPGLTFFYTLEEYQVRNFKIKFLSERSPTYLGRWFLSKLLTFGNLSKEDRIVSTFAFSKADALEELFHLIDKRIKKRKTDFAQQTYEFARELHPILFPRLPDVRDANSEPKFSIRIEELKPRKIIQRNRPRNPSAVGGKNRQEIAFLPILSQTGHEAHNVVMIFLSIEELMRDSNFQSTDHSPGMFSVLKSPKKDETEINKSKERES